MNLLKSLLVLFVLFFYSCQKEISQRVNQTPTQSSDTLLVKIVNKNGADSSVVTLSYDANKRLSMIEEFGLLFTDSLKEKLIMERNPNGYISKATDIGWDRWASSFDSSFFWFYYDASGKHKYSVYEDGTPGDPWYTRDSMLYHYNSLNQIDTISTYSINNTTGLAELNRRTEFAYSGSNVISRKTYEKIGNLLALNYEDSYTYDDKVNPFPLRTDGIGEGRIEEYMLEDLMANNAVSYRMIDHFRGSNSHTRSAVYTYDSSNRPITERMVYVGGTTFTIDSYYYYQY